MTHSKNTKKALLASILSVMLCTALLIGTTFAWFTDSVTTGVNKIQAGSLKIDLVDEDGKSLDGQSLKWVAADGRDEILWEPGCTYNLDSFKIVNKGNLALKYKVIINGVDGDAGLLKAIDFTAKVGTAEAKKLESWEGALAPEATTDLITITGHMKEESGNEYQGLSIEGIGITVVATQTPYEKDSIDDQYDANAWNDIYATANGDGTYSDGENTYVKVANKYIAVNAADVDGLYTDADNNQYVANAGAVQSVVESAPTGEAVSFTVLQDIALPKRITASGDLTINGGGNALTVERTDTASDRVIDLSYTTEKATITLNNVDLVGPTTGSYNRGISLYNNKDVTVVLNNCSVSTNYYAVNVAGLNENVNIVIKNTDLTGYAAINLWSKSNITLENCTLTGVNHWGTHYDNDFAVIVFPFDSTTSSAGSTVTLKDCKIVSDTLENKEYFFRVDADNVTINLENCKFIFNNEDVTETVKSDIANGKSQGGSRYLMWYEGNNTVFNVQ